MYFLLLILKVSFYLFSNVVYKCSELLDAFSEKDFKLVLFEKSNPVLFNLNLVLLLAEIDLFSKEQKCKKYAFIEFRISYFEIVLILQAEEVAFHL